MEVGSNRKEGPTTQAFRHPARNANQAEAIEKASRRGHNLASSLLLCSVLGSARLIRRHRHFDSITAPLRIVISMLRRGRPGSIECERFYKARVNLLPEGQDCRGQ